MCILYLTIDLVNQQTWYGTHHQLLVSWISRIRFRISRLKSVTGRYGSLGHLAGHSFLGISFMNGAWSRKSRPGNVTLSLDWLKRFLLGNRTVTYLFDRSALVHRGIATEQIWYPKGNLVYGAKKGISKREMNDKKNTTNLSIVLYIVFETFSGDIPPAFCHILFVKMLSGFPEKYFEPWEPCDGWFMIIIFKSKNGKIKLWCSSSSITLPM